MTKEQEYYFELRYKERITNFKRIREFENNGKTEEEIRETYKSINDYIVHKMNNKFSSFTISDLKDIRNSLIKFHQLHGFYYNEERKRLFDNPTKFINWYEGQNNLCGYCGISYEELQSIVEIRGKNLTLNNKKKRSKGSLEIEKKDPSLGYEFSNCILACPLCNNAKSNLIDDSSWRDIFVDPMREYYQRILNKELIFSKPK